MLPAGAFLLALVVQLLVLRGHHDHPFGDVSRNVSDFGSQYLAFHAQFRRMLGGSDPLANLWFSWTGGGGVAFLPDYAYYLGGPLTPLIGLFPLVHVEGAILAISTLRVCLAAATMSVLLQRINRCAPPALVLLLACGYACSSWVFDTAIYTPMWLDAAWGLPLALLAMHWCLERRRPVLSVLVIAVIVWGNFYTAFMVSFGCLVYLVGLLVQYAVPPRDVLRVMLRAARTMVLGWGLMAWMLVPTLRSLKAAVPVPPAGVPEVMQGIGYADYWPRLLPQTEGYGGSPAMSIGSLGLVLALSLPFAHRAARRVRWTWTVVVGLVLLLSNTAPLLWVWNAFDVPQGNHFRFSFVICAFLAVAATHAWPSRGAAPGTVREPLMRESMVREAMVREAMVQGPRGRGAEDRTPDAAGSSTVRRPVSWPGPWQLVGGGVLLALLCWNAHPHFDRVLSIAQDSRRDALVMWLCVFVVSVVIGVSVRFRPAANRGRRLVAALGLLTVGVLWTLETVQGAGFTQDVLRHRLGTMPITSGSRTIYRTSGARAVQEAGWPLHRTATVGVPNLPVFSYYNQGALLGTPSVGYYSSNMPVAVSDAYAGLGAFTDLDGRMMREVDSRLSNDPVLASLTSIKDSRQVTGPSLPMVRSMSAGPRALGPNVFDNRNALLGATVYTPARLQIGGHDVAAGGLPRRLAPGSSTSVGITCQPGRTPTLQFWKLRGSVSTPSGWHRSLNTANIVQLPPGTSRVEVTALRSALRTTELRGASCLDAGAFTRAVTNAVAPEQLTVQPGRVDARFTHPVTGTVMVSTVAQPGWRCSDDSGGLPVQSNAGFMALQVQSATRVSCRYREPGVNSGLAASVVVLLLLAATGWLERRSLRGGGAGSGAGTSDPAGASDQIASP